MTVRECQTRPCRRRSPLRTKERRSTLLPRLAVSVAERRLAELVVLRETVGLHAPGISAIAAPSRKLLGREREGAPGGIVPDEPLGALEGLEVGELAVLEALQPHAAAARHLRHLFEREDHHLAVLADRGGEIAIDPRERARGSRRLDVKHPPALAGGG